MKETISELCMALAMLSMFSFCGLMCAFVLFLDLDPAGMTTYACSMIGCFVCMMFFGTISNLLDQ